MCPGSSIESYPAFAHIGLRENPGKNFNQVTCSDRELNPGHLVSRPDALTVTPQESMAEPRKKMEEIQLENEILKSKWDQFEEEKRRKNLLFFGIEEKDREQSIDTYEKILGVCWECFGMDVSDGQVQDAFRKDVACEMDRQSKKQAVLEKVDEERMMLKLIRKRKMNWLGYWLRRKCLLKDALEGVVNGKKNSG
ncbi:hypothetical protein ANN_14189 [Periplaneta americana]|uniref:Uncharacterized protein n=1 Tax=Periplaneta americana TaxID=6978 RepID=A0ABQ8SVM4_PERAM|nr:hypothetical protein ANN_14189 [Periplaneta americana]